MQKPKHNAQMGFRLGYTLRNQKSIILHYLLDNLVNISFIKNAEINQDKITLKNGDTIPVSRGNKQKLYELLEKRLIKSDVYAEKYDFTFSSRFHLNWLYLPLYLK